VLFGWLSKVRLFAAGKAPQAWIPAGLALGGGGFLATLGMSALNGGLVNGPASDSGMGLVALGVLLTLFQTYSEELLFRGWLQQALSARVGQVAAVLLGAMLFGAFHILGGARGAVPLLNLALGGVWFGLLALRSGSVLAPLGAHFAWNAIEDLGFGLVPNPGTGPLGSFWNKDLAGPAWWGGVEDGLNASIGTTVVLVALILPLLQPRREPAAAPATA
jgi:membrane protease YdiL (CAAX protease family)